MTTSNGVTTDSLDVVVGIDASDESLAAARWAAAVAQEADVPLRLVHAWHWPYQVGASGVHPEVIRSTEAAAGAVLDRVVDQLQEDGVGVIIERCLVSGSAFGALVEHSKSAGLVVVGRHGRNAISRFFVGSTSTSVANHAHCPVAVIPSAAAPLPVDAAVMVAMDGSARSMDAASWAITEVPGAHRFVAVHSHDEWVLDKLSTPDAYRTQRQAAAEKLLDEAVALVTQAVGRPGLVVEQVVVPGDPRETVMRFSADMDLLVVGARGHSGLSGVLLGSFATYALNHSTVPLVIVRDGPASDHRVEVKQ